MGAIKSPLFHIYAFEEVPICYSRGIEYSTRTWYVPAQLTKDKLLLHCIDTLTKIDVKMDKCKLHTFYWLPKLHKILINHASYQISNSSHCSTTILSKHNIYNGNIFPSLNPAKIFQFISRWTESTKSSAVGPNHRAVINTSNEVKSPLLWEFWIYNFSLRMLERVLGWKHCKYKEWVSFFSGFMGNES